MQARKRLRLRYVAGAGEKERSSECGTWLAYKEAVNLHKKITEDLLNLQSALDNTGDGSLCSTQNTENRSLCCPDPVYPADIHALQEERLRLTESLKLTVNHVARLERLLGFLSPEEQLVLDRMLVHPYKKCTLDLMEELHCEMSSVYRLRAAAIEKLLHLRYGAGAGE